MPKGPQGHMRPADAIGNAVMVARITTGEIEDNKTESGKVRSGQAGGVARAQALSPERRSQIAKTAAAGRWS